MQIRREMDSNKQELVEKFDKVKRGKVKFHRECGERKKKIVLSPFLKVNKKSKT